MFPVRQIHCFCCDFDHHRRHHHHHRNDDDSAHSPILPCHHQLLSCWYRSIHAPTRRIEWWNNSSSRQFPPDRRVPCCGDTHHSDDGSSEYSGRYSPPRDVLVASSDWRDHCDSYRRRRHTVFVVVRWDRMDRSGSGSDDSWYVCPGPQ